jgi:hypothetical protein
MRAESKLIRSVVVSCILSIIAFSHVRADDKGSPPKVSATWSPKFPSGEVWLTITNQSSEPIRILPLLNVTMGRIGRPTPFEPWDLYDKTVITTSVDFMVSPGKVAMLEQRGPIAQPVIIAPLETKTIKLEVPPGIVYVAHVSDEAVFRLNRFDDVINVTDLRNR